MTLISTCSLCGAFVIPLSNRKIYKKMLMFLIAIAVGSLAGSGFLHLIPQVRLIFQEFLLINLALRICAYINLNAIGIWYNRRSKI